MAATLLRIESAVAPLDRALVSITSRDVAPAQAEFFRQGELLVVPRFLPRSLAALLAEQAHRLGPRLERRGITRRAGAASRHTIVSQAPMLDALYRSDALIDWISRVVDARIACCPEVDPHGCAIYDYTREGDGMRWHYDTSFYRGARFTALLVLHDGSSSRLICRTHTRSRNRPIREIAVENEPGTLVLFDGDSVLHRVTPLGEGERRTVLSLEYVTSTEMSGPARLVSNLKDATQYFGFRDFFRWFSR